MPNMKDYIDKLPKLETKKMKPLNKRNAFVENL